MTDHADTIRRDVVQHRPLQRCPVCFGKGRVPRGFYDFVGVQVYPATSAGDSEMCRTCTGRGIV